MPPVNLIFGEIQPPRRRFPARSRPCTAALPVSFDALRFCTAVTLCYLCVPHLPCYIFDSAIISGIVRTDAKLTSATVFDAVPVSLPYFAANITVLFALGAAA